MSIENNIICFMLYTFKNIKYKYLECKYDASLGIICLIPSLPIDYKNYLLPTLNSLN